MPCLLAGWDDPGVPPPPPSLPSDTGKRDGLAYSLWLPAGARPPAAGVVIIHGAGSRKENHHDFARAAVTAGFAAIAFDQRGHGASDGEMDDRAIVDVVAIATLLRSSLAGPEKPIALRGSSMGGYLAIMAAAPVRARAVVAICPASSEALARGLERGELGFAVDVPALGGLLGRSDLHRAVQSLAVPLLLLHAEGDERVPVTHSRQLSTMARARGSRLLVLPGGNHRSVQHDQQLQAESLRFIERALLADARSREVA